MKLNSSFILYAGFLIYYYPYIRDIQQNKLLSVYPGYQTKQITIRILDIQQNKLLSVYPGYTTKQIAFRISGIYNKTNCYPYLGYTTKQIIYTSEV